LINLTPNKLWSDAENPLIGITPIMNWARKHYDKEYAPNTRETIRQTMHQFCDAGIAIYNPDKLDRPVNSPKAVYQIEPTTLSLLRTFGSALWQEELEKYLVDQETLVDAPSHLIHFNGERFLGLYNTPENSDEINQSGNP
jgi:BsuBI/PstI restriction endonuclease HTH domain